MSSVLAHNKALSNTAGGALYNFYGTVNASNTEFLNNTAVSVNKHLALSHSPTRFSMFNYIFYAFGSFVTFIISIYKHLSHDTYTHISSFI